MKKIVLTEKDSIHYTYCELVGIGKHMSNKVTVKIEVGQEQNLLALYKDSETGNPILFNSMVDGLNFMSRDNWEFVQAYAITEGYGSSFAHNEYHFILKKPTLLIENGSLF